MPAVPVADTVSAVIVPVAVAVMPPAVVVRTFCSSSELALVTTIGPGAEAEIRPKLVWALMLLAAAPAVPAVRRAVLPWSSDDPPMLVAAVTVTPPPTGMKTT